jgi:hypothetical protein
MAAIYAIFKTVLSQGPVVLDPQQLETTLTYINSKYI